MTSPSNHSIADMLDRVAQLLEAQHAQGFRVRAYRHAADVIRSLDHEISAVAREGGHSALVEIAGIGPRIASAIEEIVHTGRLSMLERLMGELNPEALFALVPSIGDALAARIHHELHIDTLEELEVAAHDGRLAQLAGFGERRVLAVRQSLESMLRRSARRGARSDVDRGAHSTNQEPSVALLLEIDADYQRRARAEELPKLTPRRFNPRGEAWLPVFHAERDGWSFTALYSNTARAHKLGKTHDWVVIFFERDGDEGQCTVVTEHSGVLRGQRVVRGREPECLRAACNRRDSVTSRL